MDQDEEIDDIFEEETSKNMENDILSSSKLTKVKIEATELPEIKNEIDDLDIKIEELSEEYDIPCKTEIEPFETPYIRPKFKTHLQRLMSNKKITKKYTCLVCTQRFPSVRERNSHFSRHFDVSTMNKRKTNVNLYFGKHILTCSFCGQYSIKKMDIVTHCLVHRVKTATLKPSTRLKLSIKRNATFQDFLENIDEPKVTRTDLDTGKFKGDSQKPSSINRVGGNTQTLSNIDKKRKKRYYKCEICSTTTYSLKRHMQIHYRGKTFTYKPEKLKCNVCEREFKCVTYLRNHTRIHTGERPYECKLCPKTFRYQQDLKRHILYHTGEKPFGCKICSRHFRHKPYLKIHITNCHTGEKPCVKYKHVKCEQCSKEFKSGFALKIHRRDHTGETPYECGICAKRFTRKTNLTYHLLSHTNQKPFECGNCCMKFKQKQGLRRHLLKHTGEKNANCNICAKTFTRKDSLKQHLRTHTGEKPFRCELCPRQFALSQNMYTHMRRRHGKN